MLSEMDETDIEQERFGFGANWRRFLEVVDEDRVREAERSLTDSLGTFQLAGGRVLDLGCGSGLFSLAAVRLGAAHVVSVDFDCESVGCARELKRRFAPEAGQWIIGPGDALDQGLAARFGSFDLVYSWGVLHHTGAMWRALGNAVGLVHPGGRLFVSIYNDQGRMSRVWRIVKRTFVRLPPALRVPFALVVMAPVELRAAAISTVLLRPGRYVRSWTKRRRQRGMSRWHDLIDWVGGYPFEVARPEEVFTFCRDRGLILEHLRTAAGGLGCNEFVFARPRHESEPAPESP